MTIFRILVSVVALCAATMGLARADTAVPAVEGATELRGPRVHDGFYLRLGTGFGAYHESVQVEDADESTLVTGIASAMEVAVGYAIRPGFVLGGGFFSSHALATERTVRGLMPPPEVTSGGGEVTLFGPFMDWYLNPRGGLHFQAALGVAVAHGFGVQTTDMDDDVAAVGGGFVVGFGHDWWVSDEWSFGILARIEVLAAVGDDDTGASWTHTFGALPSLLFTTTFN